MGVTAEEQQQIYRWLNEKLRLPVYAGAYLGATRLLEQRSPGYITFVSHAARDLMNGLARTVAGIRASQVQYQQHVDRLQEEWKDEWRGRGFNEPELPGHGHMIPFPVCEIITELIGDHREGRRRNKEADDLFFRTFLGYSDIDRITNLAKWRKARDFFVPNAHLREKDFQSDINTEVQENFRILEDFLIVAATSEYSRIGTLNAILEDANSR